MSVRRWQRLFLMLPAFLVGGRPAHAHLMNTGLGPFYDGLTHPLLTPEDLLPVLALTLLAGLRGARCGRWVLFALPPAWLAGMTVGWAIVPHAAAPWFTCALTIALGALVAADSGVPLPAVVGCTLLLGLSHGVENGAGLAQTQSGLMGLAGIACAIFVVVALVTGHVASLRAAWARLVVRVAGSWIAAIGLLMLGWSLRPPVG